MKPGARLSPVQKKRLTEKSAAWKKLPEAQKCVDRAGTAAIRNFIEGSKDMPEKISYSPGVSKSHCQRHLMKMVSLWRDNFDTMAFLDWHAKVINQVHSNQAGMSKVQLQQLNNLHLKPFEGYIKGHIELQIDIFLHLPALSKHSKLCWRSCAKSTRMFHVWSLRSLPRRQWKTVIVVKQETFYSPN